MRSKAMILALLSVVIMTGCGKEAETEQAKPQVDRTIPYASVMPEKAEGSDREDRFPEIKVISHGNGGELKPHHFTEEEIRQTAEESGLDRDGDGILTAKDFDVEDDAGFDIEARPIYSEDYIYEPEDTESDDYMSEMITLKGISGTGRYLCAQKLEVMEDERDISVEDGGTAVMIGNPYIIGVSPSKDFATEFDDFSDTPISTTFYCTEDMLKDVGTGSWQKDKVSVYARMPGEDNFTELDTYRAENSLEFMARITRPGEYAIAFLKEQGTVSDDSAGEPEEERGEITEE